MPTLTSEDLDTLFPNRHAIAEAVNLHPSLRDSFIPYTGEPLTDEQRDAICPPERRALVVRDVLTATQCQIVEAAS